MVVATTTHSKYFIYKLGGVTKEEISLDFGTNHKNANHIIHRAYVTQAAQARQGTSLTKNRAEVRGGGRKPWKQKGIGRARAGSNRSPLWRGGGVIFGPKNPQYSKKINKKEKLLALRACLNNRKSKIIISNNFFEDCSKPSTKLILQILNNWEINTQNKILIVTKTKDFNLYLSTRNIPNINMILASHLNVKYLLLAETIIISQDTIPMIMRKYT